MKWFLEMVCDMQLFPFFFHMDNQWPDVIYWNVHSFSTNQSSNGQLCANWKSVPSLRQSDCKNHPIWMGQLVKKKIISLSMCIRKRFPFFPEDDSLTGTWPILLGLFSFPLELSALLACALLYWSICLSTYQHCIILTIIALW